MSPELEAALAACVSEPIHIPGAIQDFGVLVCLDENLQYVQQVSNNVTLLLDLAVAECIGMKASRLLGKPLVDQLCNALQDQDRIAEILIAPLASKNGNQRVYVNAYRSGENVVVELEPVEAQPAAVPTEQARLPAVNRWLEAMTRCQSPDEVLDKLVRAVRSVTEYDRALIYKFDSNFNGAVVAESRTDFLSPFLGHHFPASDIPSQARAMYQYNGVRFIADSRGIPVPLVPQNNPETGRPLDLSLGTLRAVSPVHQQYLQNMGVGAALSIAIFSEKGLWGLVSCHSQRPRPTPLSVREAAATLTHVASQRLFLLYGRAAARYRSVVQSQREAFVERMASIAPIELLRRQAAEWRELLGACGLVFSHRDSIFREGTTPAPDSIEALTAWLRTQITGLAPWASNSLTDSGYPGEVDMRCGCGVLAMPLDNDLSTKSWLLFFRPEKKRTILWGGKPEDIVIEVENQPRLSPRHSFASWQEVVHGTSEPWRAAEKLAIRDFGSDLAVAISAHEITRLNTALQKEQKALAQANERLRQLALTDPLTGAGNRQKAEDDIDSAINSAQRYGAIFSLVLFDIDHFKEINDTHGHNKGDQVLKRLVERVNECLRKSDTLGRWGGEEFVILMPNTASAGAYSFAERLRQEVEATDFGLDQKITVSLGVTQWQPHDDRTGLVARADAAMYAAKQSGRNRVSLSSDGHLEN